MDCVFFLIRETTDRSLMFGDWGVGLEAGKTKRLIVGIGFIEERYPASTPILPTPHPE
jgi:hypothetical protein